MVARSFGFSQDGKWLVYADDRIRWINTENGAVVASLDHKLEAVRSVVVSPDGRTLALVHSKFRQQHRDLSTGRKSSDDQWAREEYRSRGDVQRACELSPDGRTLAVGKLLSGQMEVFDTSTGRLVAFYPTAHGSPIAALAFSPDGQKLATADDQRTIESLARRRQAQCE